MKFPEKDLITIIEKASTLFERLSPQYYLTKEAKDVPSGVEREKKWCMTVAGKNREKFFKRLSWDGLDPYSIRPALVSVNLKNKKNLPSWAKIIKECLESSRPNRMEESPKERLFPDADHPIPYGKIFAVFVQRARKGLKKKAGSSTKNLTDGAQASLENDLLGWISYICSTVMEEEFMNFFSLNKPDDAQLQIQSEREDIKSHYEDFSTNMLSGGLLELFKKYPVLARLVGNAVEMWENTTAQFLLRLETDLPEIQEKFSRGKRVGKVTAILPHLSDRHNNGFSVMAIRFASGLELIYKPKDLGMDLAYNGILEWLNQHSRNLPFKLLKVLNRSTHGWIDYVKHSPCQNKNEAKRFYRRAGMLLYLTYILEGTDFHYENIIASGEHPVIIDMETLMHHRIFLDEAHEFGVAIKDMASAKIWESILRTGILPRWEIGQEGRASDISGLTGFRVKDARDRFREQNSTGPDEEANSTEYRYGETGLNIQSLKGKYLNPIDYIEDFIGGFERMHRIFKKHRKSLLQNNAPLKDLSRQQTRIIFRPTKVYATILKKALQPAYLQNGADKSILQDILSKAFLDTKTLHPLWPILRAEHEALDLLDIPVFHSRGDSDALMIDDRKTIAECFPETSFDRLTSHLNTLNKKELDNQLEYIRWSFFSHGANTLHTAKFKDLSEFQDESDLPFLSESDCLNQAYILAKEIQQRAVRSPDGSVIWIAPQFIPEAQVYQIRPLDFDLYDGNCGPALFLSAVQKISGSSEFEDLISGALKPLYHCHQNFPSPDGGAIGLGSILYSMVRIGRLKNDANLLELALKYSHQVGPRFYAGKIKADVLSGTAGTLLGLLVLYRETGHKKVLDRAIDCGLHLVKNRATGPWGHKVWATDSRSPLTGFSEGAAGIAYALLRLFEETQEKIFLDTAKEAISYEKSVFSKKEGNWPDFRSSDGHKKQFAFMTSWCHGAPGIGLARLGGLNILDTDDIRRDIDVAIQATESTKLQECDNLCCGNLGRVEFLFSAARFRSDTQLLKSAMRRVATITQHAKSRQTFGYLSHGKCTCYHPGFFQGASGIGYQLLRITHPDVLPSVLLWE